jgi:probable F420-dependent oxidoreductase
MTDSYQPADTKAAQRLADKFGSYIVPGRVSDPARGIIEAQQAEQFGLGTAWISERYGLKEIGVMAGAVCNATSTIKIGGTTYPTVRHPIVSASLCNLMQALSKDRFRLLLARAVQSWLADLGLPLITFERTADFIAIMRRLWAGETVSYQGVLGNFPNLVLPDRYDGPPPPIYITAIGPKTLAFAGEHCDGALLHPFINAEGVKKSAAIVRNAAERAGRDPAAVRIIHTVVVAPDLPKAEEEAVVGGRAVTYFQIPGYGETLAEINGWDTAVLTKLRAHPTFQNMNNALADQAFTREQLVEASRVLPDQWYQEGAAMGSAALCAQKLCAFLAAGADEIALHGAAPKDMGSLTAELRKLLA